MTPEPVRVALSIGDAFRAWEADVVAAIKNTSIAEVVGWHRAETGTNLATRARLPSSVERAIEEDHRFGTVPLSEAVAGLAALAGSNHDGIAVVLHLGGSEPSTPDKGAVRHWSFLHADHLPGAALPPGLRESILEMHQASFRLVDLTHGHVLKECLAPVDGSLLETANRIVQLAIKWPVQCLLEEQIAVGAPGATALEEIDFPSISPWRILARKWRRFWGSSSRPALDNSGPWNIGVLHQPIHVLLQEDGSRNVRWLPNPSKGKSRMEPFGYLDAAGELNALFRKGDDDGGDGMIARVRPKADNILKRSRTMLERSTEAGYPFVASIEGKPCALITDTEAGEVRVMPVMANGAGLEEGRIILHEALHAPSLFEHEGRWWLFGTRDPWPEAQLHACFASTPYGPFQEHACAPLKCDTRNARPAGTPFVHEGLLYRPALDATDPSHLAVWLNRVDLLTPDLFVETPVRRIDGFPATAYGQGVRTINALGDITLVDGLRSPVVDGAKANGSRGRGKPKKKRRSA